MTPEKEIIELKAQVTYLTSQLELIQQNLFVKNIAHQELDECKYRLDHIEDQIMAFKHTSDLQNIVSGPNYPVYFPYTAPIHVGSRFTPSRFLHCESHQ